MIALFIWIALFIFWISFILSMWLFELNKNRIRRIIREELEKNKSGD